MLADGSAPADATVLAPDSAALSSLALQSPSPAERDSMLLLDPAFDEAGTVREYTCMS
jgi:hypothetical protein